MPKCVEDNEIMKHLKEFPVKCLSIKGKLIRTEDSLYHVIKVKLALVLMGHSGIVCHLREQQTLLLDCLYKKSIHWGGEMVHCLQALAMEPQ